MVLKVLKCLIVSKTFSKQNEKAMTDKDASIIKVFFLFISNFFDSAIAFPK